MEKEKEMAPDEAIRWFNRKKSSDQLFTLQGYIEKNRYDRLFTVTRPWNNGFWMKTRGLRHLRDPNGGDKDGGNQKYFKFLQLIVFKVIEEFDDKVPKERRQYLLDSTYQILHKLQENATGGDYYIDKNIHNNLYTTLKENKALKEIEGMSFEDETEKIITLSDSKLMTFIGKLLENRKKAEEAAVAEQAEVAEEEAEVAEEEVNPLKRPLDLSDKSDKSDRTEKEPRIGGKKTKKRKSKKRKSKKRKSKKRKNKKRKSKKKK